MASAAALCGAVPAVSSLSDSADMQYNSINGVMPDYYTLFLFDYVCPEAKYGDS